jgi:hypothetical protein
MKKVILLLKKFAGLISIFFCSASRRDATQGERWFLHEFLTSVLWTADPEILPARV